MLPENNVYMQKLMSGIMCKTGNIRECGRLTVFAVFACFSAVIYGFSVDCLINLSLMIILHELSIEDYNSCTIRNRFIAAIGMIYVMKAVSWDMSFISQGLAAAAVSACILFVTVLAGKLVLHRKMLGGGDIKLILVMSLFLNAEKVLCFLLIFCFFGIALFTASGKKKGFPLGPAIAAAAMICLI